MSRAAWIYILNIEHFENNQVGELEVGKNIDETNGRIINCQH